MVTHIVMFNFKSEGDAEAVQEKLLGMAGKIPGLSSIEAGLDFTKSERSYQLGLITRHPSQEDLEVYRTHPVHLEVVAFVKERASGSAAVDFES